MDSTGSGPAEEGRASMWLQTRRQDMMTFKDVAVEFTNCEWDLLDLAQKAMYREVMLENFKNLASLGLPVSKPYVICQLEEGEEPCVLEGEISKGTHSGEGSYKCDMEFRETSGRSICQKIHPVKKSYFTLERNPTNVTNVGEPLVTLHPLLSTRELILERSLMNAGSVGEPSARVPLSLYIIGFILERDPTNVINVGEPSARVHPSLNITDSILERSPTDVMSVGEALRILHLLLNIRKTMLGKKVYELSQCRKASRWSRYTI
ncbi:PREDICTED: zinc finger protein 514 isoform X2 [Condylura cristata]|uniref:zinc finger protein 514 isoform X2 n=1 Tax=Condylura cristata TaxID=143302 RepID=UPI000643A4C1|nr:PREDICTED: zinc finger protein 514 isoform X2 [Condylura cristata]